MSSLRLLACFSRNAALRVIPSSRRVLVGARQIPLSQAPIINATFKHFHGCTSVFDKAAAPNKPAFLDEHEVLERVLTVVKNFEKIDPTKVTAAAKFKDDLGLDSLDTVEVVMAIEDEFGIVIPDDEADAMVCVKDAVAFIASHPHSH